MRRRTLLATALLTGCSAGAEPVARPVAPAGTQRLEQVRSAYRGRVVDLYTAVPHGYGDGRGLPVCLVLHGGSKRPADFAALGLGGFLTDAVRRGTPPFVLAGATGDRLAWQPAGDDDPRRMVREELTAWCAARGFDTGRLAAWGWSMGGSGALLLAATHPGLLRAVAAFSPAVTPGDAVFATAGLLSGTPIGLWCGLDDPLCPRVRALQSVLPDEPAAGGYAPGRHNFAYWSGIVAPAFDFVGRRLAGADQAR